MNYNQLIEKVVYNVLRQINESLSEEQKYRISVNLIEKGYLIHCTNADFNEFDSKFIQGGSRAKEGYGFYFSDMPYKSIQYGNNFKIIKKDKFNFLNLEDKVDISMFNPTNINIEIEKLNMALDYVRNNKDYEYIQSEIEKLKQQKSKYDNDLLFYIEDAIKNGNGTYGSMEYNLRNPQTNIPKLIKVYMENGYDGGYYDGIYTVWNFNKLNQNIINLNDKELKEMLLNQ